jgi:hypothetical protein
MWTRRQFLSRSSLAVLGVAGTALAVPSDTREELPDGSASRGMVTPRADEVIARGLAFLAANQNQDGSFGTGMYYGNVAVTSLAGLAFLAGGHHPGRGPYGAVVTRTLEAVLGMADRSGNGFLHNGQGAPPNQGSMYGHGFGTLFLGEVHGMVTPPDLRDRLRAALKAAVDLILDSQNKNHEGGWRYHPNSPDADLSVTICQIMALRSARNAGFYIPKSQVDKCVKYVRDCAQPDGTFRYQRLNNAGPPDPLPRTAAGICALYSAGVYKDPLIENGLRWLMEHKPGSSRQANGFFQRENAHYYYGQYYAAQAMWTAGGNYWAEWFPAIREELVESPHRRPQANGSWVDPMICNHYATAMACIILQIPDNYLPILQK